MRGKFDMNFLTAVQESSSVASADVLLVFSSLGWPSWWLLQDPSTSSMVSSGRNPIPASFESNQNSPWVACSAQERRNSREGGRSPVVGRANCPLRPGMSCGSLLVESWHKRNWKEAYLLWSCWGKNAVNLIIQCENEKNEKEDKQVKNNTRQNLNNKNIRYSDESNSNPETL